MLHDESLRPSKVEILTALKETGGRWHPSGLVVWGLELKQAKLLG